MRNYLEHEIQEPSSIQWTQWVNQIIADILQTYVVTKPTYWECYIACFEFTCNNSKNTSMGHSTSMLMYMFQPWASIDVNIHNDELRSTQNFVMDMQGMLNISRDNIKTTEDRDNFMPTIIRNLVYWIAVIRYFLAVAKIR